MNSTIEVEKLTGLMGAEICGLDLTKPIADETAELLRQALADHQMIVIRQQFLSLKDQKRLTAIFGAVMKLPYITPLDDDDEVIAVLKEAHETNTGVFGGEWHSDFSFLENPPAGSVLNAIEVPDVGGDTVWASQVAAYASLPEKLKKIIDNRNAIHVGKPYGVKHKPPAGTLANSSIQIVRDDPAADREIRHPAVITEPYNGRKALFLNPIYTVRFEGMSEIESGPYLAAIYRHCTRPDFSCRLRWQAGDVAVWDNRMSLHYATNDYDGQRRLLYRTTFKGPPPA